MDVVGVVTPEQPQLVTDHVVLLADAARLVELLVSSNKRLGGNPLEPEQHPGVNLPESSRAVYPIYTESERNTQEEDQEADHNKKEIYYCHGISCIFYLIFLSEKEQNIFAFLQSIKSKNRSIILIKI